MNCKYCRANCTGAKQDREITFCLGYDPPKTNADRIRSMTDEELAKFISGKARGFGEEYEGYMSALDWLKEECES